MESERLDTIHDEILHLKSSLAVHLSPNDPVILQSSFTTSSRSQYVCTSLICSDFSLCLWEGTVSGILSVFRCICFPRKSRLQSLDRSSSGFSRGFRSNPGNHSLSLPSIPFKSDTNSIPSLLCLLCGLSHQRSHGPRLCRHALQVVFLRSCRTLLRSSLWNVSDSI